MMSKALNGQIQRSDLGCQFQRCHLWVAVARLWSLGYRRTYDLYSLSIFPSAPAAARPSHLQRSGVITSFVRAQGSYKLRPLRGLRVRQTYNWNRRVTETTGLLIQQYAAPENEHLKHRSFQDRLLSAMKCCRNKRSCQTKVLNSTFWSYLRQSATGMCWTCPPVRSPFRIEALQIHRCKIEVETQRVDACRNEARPNQNVEAPNNSTF